MLGVIDLTEVLHLKRPFCDNYLVVEACPSYFRCNFDPDLELVVFMNSL
jgi:hypothetical protein